MRKSNLASGIRLMRALKDPRVPMWIKFLPLVAVVYLLSPFDFVPDPIPVVGWLDDLVIVITLLSQAVKALGRFDAKSLPPMTP